MFDIQKPHFGTPTAYERYVIGCSSARTCARHVTWRFGQIEESTNDNYTDIN